MTQATAVNALAERDDITLLTPKIFTGKTLTWRGDRWEKSPNATAKHFNVKTRSISTILEAFDVLSTADNAILIHGRPLSTTPKVDALRRAENFADAPHRLITLDLEGFATDSTDAETVGKQARAMLPVEFHDAAFIMHLSSGFGMEPGIGRAHLFFYASRPVTRAELTAWLSPMRAHKQVGAPDKSILDECVWRRVQPTYLVNPVFVGAPDPFPQRWILLDGAPEVIAPDTFEIVENARADQKRGLPARADALANEPHMILAALDCLSGRKGERIAADGRHMSIYGAAQDFSDRAVSEELAEALLLAWSCPGEDSTAALRDALDELEIEADAIDAIMSRVAGIVERLRVEAVNDDADNSADAYPFAGADFDEEGARDRVRQGYLYARNGWGALYRTEAEIDAERLDKASGLGAVEEIDDYLPEAIKELRDGRLHARTKDALASFMLELDGGVLGDADAESVTSARVALEVALLANPLLSREKALLAARTAYALALEPDGEKAAKRKDEIEAIVARAGKPNAEEKATDKASKFRVETFDDAARTALDDADKPLVAGLLDEGAMSVLYGASNSGKTFVALDLAYHIAVGRAWDGRRVSQGLVVYVAAEGGQRIKRRVAALRAHYCGEDSASVRFALVRSSIDLCTSDKDAAEISRIVKEQEALFGTKAALVVVDTLSRAMAGRDENSSIDMGALVANCDRIRANTGSHLMIVHHAGKDATRGARGHSLLRAATDTELEVIGAKGRGKIEVKKQRDLDFAPDMPFRLADVTLGVDADGAAVKSAVVVLDGATAATGEGLACNDDDARDLGAGPEAGRMTDEPATLRPREQRILEIVRAEGEPVTQTGVLEAYNRRWGRVDGVLGKDAVKNSLEKLRGAYLDQTQEMNRALRRWFAVEADDAEEGSE